jgi:hypothetical protein
MISRLWTGYVVSVVSAAVAFVLLREAAALLTYFPRGRLTDAFYILVFVGVGILLTAWPFFLVTCMIGERLRLRNRWYYAGCGALTATALVFWYAQSSPWDEMPAVDRSTPPNLPQLFVSAISGGLAGLAYWFVSGRWAGSPSRARLPHSS